MATIRVRANINTLGLSPSDEAEIEVTPAVEAAVSIGYLSVLVDPAPKVAEEVAEVPEAPAQRRASRKSAATAVEVPEGVEGDTEAAANTE
jgi:hypothetical protein